MTTPPTPAGWYPDGQGLRWFDGQQWTAHTMPMPPAEPEPAPEPEPRPGYDESATRIRPSGPPPLGPPPSGPPAAPWQPAGAPAYGATFGAPAQQPAQPAGPGGPGGLGAKVWALIGGGALVVILIVVLLVAVLGRSSSSPTGVVSDFYSAVKAGDCSGAKDLLTESLAAEVGECGDDFGIGEDVDSYDVAVGDATVDGDEATVDVTITVTLSDGPDPEPLDGTVGLTRDGGDWRISDLG